MRTPALLRLSVKHAAGAGPVSYAAGRMPERRSGIPAAGAGTVPHTVRKAGTERTRPYGRVKVSVYKIFREGEI